MPVPTHHLFKGRSVARLVAIWFFCGLATIGPATAGGATSQTGKPTEVSVGVWFDDIHSIDFVNGSFGAQFYIWWVSPDPTFRPFEMLQILNGRNWTSHTVNRRELPDGTFHTSGIVSVTVNHDWQLEYFPFDRQDLNIVIETPQTSNEIRIVPNNEKSVIGEFMHVEGFRVSDLELVERVQKYATDFGIKADAANSYSRLVIKIGMQRESGRLIVAMLIGFIVANIIALLTYAIHVSNLGIRTAMVGSAIFGAVGNMYSLNTALNPAVGSMLVDRFAIGTFSAIVIALLNAIIVERLASKGRSGMAHMINRLAFYFVLVLSITFYLVAFAAAIHGSHLDVFRFLS